MTYAVPDANPVVLLW